MFDIQKTDKKKFVLYYTKEFREKLLEIYDDTVIARDLFESEFSHIEWDATFISLGARSGKIKFSQINNILSQVKNYYQKEFENYTPSLKLYVEGCIEKIQNGNITYSDLEELWDNTDIEESKSRIETSVGKFVNKILPNKYTSAEVEKFVNYFKSNSKEIHEIEMISGNEIAKWFYQDNYYGKEGDLGSSCMRFEECLDYLDLYTENPQVCQMLIYKKNEKLLGRALLWKIEGCEDIDYFMDRVYAIDEPTKVMFDTWADKKRCLRKYKIGDEHIKSFVLKGKIKFNTEISVKLTNWNFDKYPYLDTMRRLNIQTGILSNSCSIQSSDSNENKYYILESLIGLYH